MKGLAVLSLWEQDYLQHCVCVCVCVLVVQLYLTLCDPMDYNSQGSSVHEILHAKYYSGLPFPSKEIFLIQELNPGLLHCRPILHH